MEREILLLGNPALYEISEEVKEEELELLRPVFEDMFDCIRGIRRDYGFGRAIAAPQIGIKKRLICMLTDQPRVIINPTLEPVGDELMELRMKSQIGSMNDEIEIAKEGKDLLIGFNPKFLIDALRVIDDEEVTLYLMNAKAPCFIKDEEESYIYLILPVNFNAAV